MITQAKRMKLRDQFKREKGINWMNSQGEPDMDYVEWLEGNLLERSKNSDYEKCLAIISHELKFIGFKDVDIFIHKIKLKHFT